MTVAVNYLCLMLYIYFALSYFYSPLNILASTKLAQFILTGIGMIFAMRIFLNGVQYQRVIIISLLTLFWYTSISALFSYDARVAINHLVASNGGLLHSFFMFFAIFYAGRYIVLSQHGKLVLLLLSLINLVTSFVLYEYVLGGLKFGQFSYVNELIGARYQPISDQKISLSLCLFLLTLTYEWARNYNVLFHVLFMGNCLIDSVTFQFMGSNSGTVLSLALLFLSVCRFALTFTKLFASVALVGGVFLVNKIDFTSYLDIVLSLKIFNYGTESSLLSTSVTSRLKILDNAIPMMNVNPWFGDMKAESGIADDGKFPHSLLISLISHTGILGLSLFFLSTVSSIYGSLKKISFQRTTEKITLLALFAVFLGFAVLAKFWTWQLPYVLFAYCTVRNHGYEENRNFAYR